MSAQFYKYPIAPCAGISLKDDLSDYFLIIVDTWTILFTRLFILRRFSSKCYAAETRNKSKLIYHPSPPIAFSRVPGLRSHRRSLLRAIALLPLTSSLQFPSLPPHRRFLHTPIYPPRPCGLFLPSANSPLSYGDTYQRDSVENCLLVLPAFNILIPRRCQETLREILSDVKHSVAKYSRVITLARGNTWRHLD